MHPTTATPPIPIPGAGAGAGRTGSEDSSSSSDRRARIQYSTTELLNRRGSSQETRAIEPPTPPVFWGNTEVWESMIDALKETPLYEPLKDWFSEFATEASKLQAEYEAAPTAAEKQGIIESFQGDMNDSLILAVDKVGDSLDGAAESLSLAYLAATGQCLCFKPDDAVHKSASIMSEKFILDPTEQADYTQFIKSPECGDQLAKKLFAKFTTYQDESPQGNMELHDRIWLSNFETLVGIVVEKELTLPIPL